VKFPAQADTNNEDQTKGFDALTDAGLLTRTPEEKKRFLIGSKQVNDYDLSDKGRAAWSVDPQQPGFGNFCYGHRNVTTVDDFINNAGTAAVNYHYRLGAVAPWADNTEMKTAFPTVQASLASPLSDKAILTLTDDSWIFLKSAQTPAPQTAAQR